MSFKLAEAYVELSARGFGGVSGIIDKTTAKFGQMGASIGAITRALPGVGTLLAAVGAGAGGMGLLKMAASAEQTAISFEVLLGSTDKAKRMIAELEELGAKTPFEFGHLAEAAKSMLNFGMASEEVMPAVSQLSDIASGNAQKLGSLAYVFGQVASAGKLTGQDWQQFVNAGFNPLQNIAVSNVVVKTDFIRVAADDTTLRTRTKKPSVPMSASLGNGSWTTGETSSRRWATWSARRSRIWARTLFPSCSVPKLQLPKSFFVLKPT